MKKIFDLCVTERVKNLREFYLNNSPMAVNRDLVAWKCHRSNLLYIEGWKENKWAPTIRMRRALAEAHMLANTNPVIINGELIVGQPDFSEFSAEEEQRNKEAGLVNAGIPVKQGRADHLAMDYKLLLKYGVKGIIKLLKDKVSAIDITIGSEIEKYEYYQCCIIELEGFEKMCKRYAQAAKDLADKSQGKEKEELMQLYGVLEYVPENPARTFREALQSIHMYTWSLYGLFSYGKPDLYLIDYYRKDIESGVLTLSEAQELIDCFFLQAIPNMSAWASEGLMLGGRDENGKLVENELTAHFLTAIKHTRIPDPNVGFCITRETSEELIEFVAELVGTGNCQPQIWNSDEVTKNMLKNGFDEKASYMFTMSTCSEITPIGRSGVSITSPYINLPKIFLTALNKCDNKDSFESIFTKFKAEYDAFCKQVILSENLWQLERGRNFTDPVRCSVLIHSCLEKGMSNDCGGADFNQLEPNILGMQNVSESLNVIKQLVFVEKSITLEELKKAVSDNYNGYESLLNVIRNKINHFGNGSKETNDIAKRVADITIDGFKNMTTVRGANVVVGAFSYREHESQGKKTPATPDGRRNGAPLNDGSCPVQGYDIKGPTVSMASASAWESSRFLGGTSINIKINEGMDTKKIASLIKGIMNLKINMIQINAVNKETLIKAQKNPDEYGNLLVRIGGYSDFFVKLSKNLQDEIISRSQNEL